jgi:hypothetical protein
MWVWLVDRATARQYAPAVLHAVNAVLLLIVVGTAALLLGAENPGPWWAVLALYIIVVPVGFAALVAVLFAIAWARLAPAVAPEQKVTRAIGAGTAVGQILLFVVWLSTLDPDLLYSFAVPYGVLSVVNIGTLVACWR